MSLHPEFVHQVTGVTEKLFSSPDIEVELSSQVTKRHHEVQVSVFNKLQMSAMKKVEELDEFVGLQVDVQQVVEGRVRPFNSGHLHWAPAPPRT